MPKFVILENCAYRIMLMQDIVAILHLLIALALHFRAPIRFPTNVNVQVLIYTRQGKQIRF